MSIFGWNSAILKNGFFRKIKKIKKGTGLYKPDIIQLIK